MKEAVGAGATVVVVVEANMLVVVGKRVGSEMGSMVPVQAALRGQHATLFRASAEQIWSVRQQRPGALRLLQAA